MSTLVELRCSSKLVDLPLDSRCARYSHEARAIDDVWSAAWPNAPWWQTSAAAHLLLARSRSATMRQDKCDVTRRRDRQSGNSRMNSLTMWSRLSIRERVDQGRLTSARKPSPALRA